jgi:hypothetical protein
VRVERERWKWLEVVYGLGTPGGPGGCPEAGRSGRSNIARYALPAAAGRREKTFMGWVSLSCPSPDDIALLAT